jgi:predicted metal-binding membrane protein
MTRLGLAAVAVAVAVAVAATLWLATGGRSSGSSDGGEDFGDASLSTLQTAIDESQGALIWSRARTAWISSPPTTRLRPTVSARSAVSAQRLERTG